MSLLGGLFSVKSLKTSLTVSKFYLKLRKLKKIAKNCLFFPIFQKNKHLGLMNQNIRRENQNTSINHHSITKISTTHKDNHSFKHLVNLNVYDAEVYTTKLVNERENVLLGAKFVIIVGLKIILPKFVSERLKKVMTMRKTKTKMK